MASQPQNFWPRFVLDLANNHQGSVERGLEIIRAHGRVFKNRGIPAAIKFQFRDLDHYRHGDDAYMAKFRASQLSDDSYNLLAYEARKWDFQVGATAFDPSSAEKLKGYDFAKVASCSMKDRDTVSAIFKSGLPVVFSTGGLTKTDVLRYVFDDNIKVGGFAVMHCVSLYPCSEYRCDLARIPWLKSWYAAPIGWSTHEDPDNTLIVQMATAAGATIFERHIGLGGENAYTSSPNQIDKWVTAWEHAQGIVGYPDRLERSDELAALARVERKNQVNADRSEDSNWAALEGGDIPPSWAYGVFADGVLSDNVR